MNLTSFARVCATGKVEELAGFTSKNYRHFTCVAGGSARRPVSTNRRNQSLASNLGRFGGAPRQLRWLRHAACIRGVMPPPPATAARDAEPILRVAAINSHN